MDDEFIRPRLAALLEHFSELGDGRDRWRIAYPLEEVLLLVTCATICTCDDFEDIVTWGETHIEFLRQFSEFHFGIPCARWLRDLLNRVDLDRDAQRFHEAVLAARPLMRVSVVVSW